MVNSKKTVVITNRYDGIDLPDDSCRLLIIDSKPYFRSLSDIYEETCRANSEVINTQIAQKIEQGLGRSVRGEKDYSAIIITGADLVKFIKSSATSKFFSEQTRKQIEIGLEIASLAKEDLDKKEHPIKVVESLLRQSLDRDEGWKEFYKEKMDEIEFEKVNSSLLELINCENEAEYYHYSGNNEKAISTIQKIIDNYCDTNDERGWYLQTQARYKYAISVLESNKLQLAAFKANYQLLHPKEGLSYNKINYININRIDRIKKFIDGQESYNELILSIDHILGALVFGMSSEKFELALQELGSALGFISQRPDKEYKKGPDNLWCGINDKYVLFECKSEVAIDRGEINKYEAGQMNSHCGWFKETYGEKFVKRILIIPTKKLSYHANFTDNVEIMRLASLKKLKENVKGFFKEFKNFDIKEISEEKINEFIKTHELTIDDITDKYSEVYYHNKK
ncbi:helicase C-terminal domain-containing protein [Rhizosphaericola mali]|uniref:helicase C-terminal domain-containing protein n=1 Tax=Rhizosphaericola mali TaxID=2545455 RepID=UPI001CDA05CC|nr:helicase C-terminal domain-containing protein [Rhizosphaericola mali]